MSNTDSRPPSDRGAHTIYGARPKPGSGRRTRWIFIAIGVVLGALALWWIYTATTPAQTGFGGPGGAGARGGAAAGGRAGGRGGRSGAGGLPTAVNAVKVAQGDIPVYLNELGTATPPATVTVVAQISGQLQSVGFKEGQTVKKGQFLAQIDPRPYQQMLLNAQATEAKDQALLANARVDLKRYQTLLAQDSVASQQVDTQAALVRQDEAQVKADAATVAQQKLNLIYCHITAPVSGRVGLRQVDPGNYVTAGSTNGLVVITVVDPMDVLFTLPEDNLAQVTARMRSGAELPAVALDRSQASQLAAGKLFTLDNQVDTTTGTVRAKARFDNANGTLFPNQFVNIRLTVDTLHNIIVAPTSAILKGPNGMFVYTVEKSGYATTVTVTPVTVGAAAGENTAILSGLQAGDVVVTDGSDRLKEGARVMLPGDCIPAGAGRRGAGAATPGTTAGAAGGKPKSSGGFFGLFAPKPAADPMASFRCKPGQQPSSLLSGGNPFALSFGPSKGVATSAPAPSAAAAMGPTATTTTTSKTVSTSNTEAAPVVAPASTSAPEVHIAPPPPQGGASSGGGGGGGGRAGRLQAMIMSLNLDPAQQQQAKAIFDAAEQQSAGNDDPRAKFQAFGAAITKLETVLRPDQKAKVEQWKADMAARRAQRAAAGGQPDQ